MKKILFAASLLFAGFGVHAQQLVIENPSPCDMLVRAYEDNGSCGIGFAQNVTVPAGNSATLTVSGTTGNFVAACAKDAGYVVCGGTPADKVVGDACTIYPNTDWTTTVTSCNTPTCVSGTVVNLDWQVHGSNRVLTMY